MLKNDNKQCVQKATVFRRLLVDVFMREAAEAILQRENERNARLLGFQLPCLSHHVAVVIAMNYRCSFPFDPPWKRVINVNALHDPE